MQNVKLLAPQGISYDNLPELAIEAINKVFGQFVNPMPGTVPFKGRQVIDAITDDSFDPKLMSLYGIDWELIFLGRWDGKSDDWNEIIVPLDAQAFMDYLPDIEGEDKVFRIPHAFAGWPILKTKI